MAFIAPFNKASCIDSKSLAANSAINFDNSWPEKGYSDTSWQACLVRRVFSVSTAEVSWQLISCLWFPVTYLILNSAKKNLSNLLAVLSCLQAIDCSQLVWILTNPIPDFEAKPLAVLYSGLRLKWGFFSLLATCRCRLALWIPSWEIPLFFLVFFLALFPFRQAFILTPMAYQGFSYHLRVPLFFLYLRRRNRLPQI